MLLLGKLVQRFHRWLGGWSAEEIVGGDTVEVGEFYKRVIVRLSVIAFVIAI